MGENYDSIDALLKAFPLETLDYGKIRYQFSTGANRSIYEQNSGGRRRLKQSRYRVGVMTPIGDILEAVWYEVALKLIDREYDRWILDTLHAWYAQHGPKQYLAYLTSKEKASEAFRDAVAGCIRGIYDNEAWVDFIPFNSQYRSKALKDKEFLTILPECCQRKGQISEKVAVINGYFYCPHCGRWAPAMSAPVIK